MAKKQQVLNQSRLAKNDEFYTLYEDIADELPRYKSQLKGKRILCPCDWDESFKEALVYKEEGYIAPTDLLSMGGCIKQIDIKYSKEKIERDLNDVRCNFVKFLVSHAEAYGIKSVSVSGYNPESGEGVKFQDIDYNCYDVVITNPPFSQVIELFDLMMNTNTEFLIIGPQTAIGYKEAFKYIKANRMWLGYHYHLSGFVRPDGTIIPKNDSLPRCCCWYTNMDVSYRHDKMILTEKYSSEKYPSYYNYDAVDVSKTLSIPYDYDGKMGVPITFLQKYNPEQFEIIESNRETVKTIRWNGDKANLWIAKDEKPWKCPFERIIIRNREVYHDED